MHAVQEVFQDMNWWGLAALFTNAVAALVCITFHELSHGFAAWKLGDPTAKYMGRLSLNPIKHLDVLGFLMMIFAGVGWAKPVPVDMRNFKNPKRGMAITALAGPVSNFLMAFVTLLVCSLMYHFLASWGRAVWVVFYFLCNMAILSVGLGLFNLIPISPLDGSKVLFSFLPDRVYYTILRYERYVMIALVALTFFGAFRGPLSTCIYAVLEWLCSVVGLPFDMLLLGSQILDIFEYMG